MASKYDGLARCIIQNVGGKGNVINVVHCATRLRFQLKDEGKVNDEVLESLDGVIKVIHAGGLCQIVIGPHVNYVYEAVVEVGHLQAGGEVDDDGDPVADDGDTPKKRSFLNWAIDLVSSSLQPTLGVLSAAGLFKCILTVLTLTGVLTADDGAYKVWNSFADGFFYFLPVMLGYSTAKKFKMPEFVGMALGAALCYPAMVALKSGDVLGTVFGGTPFELSYYATFFGIPIVMPASGYTSSIIPTILAVGVTSKFYKWLVSWMPTAVSLFAVPLLALGVCVPLTYLVIGPIATLITNALCFFFTSVQAIPVVGGTLYGALVGGFWQILVIFGMHWALVPLTLANLGSTGVDNILTPNFTTTFACTATVLAIFLKTKNIKLKELALPAMITGIFGTTEPALYGITLPRRKPLLISCIAAAIGSAWIGFNGCLTYSNGYSGILGFPRFINPHTTDMTNLINMAIGVVVAIIISFLGTWLFWRDDEPSKEAVK